MEKTSCHLIQAIIVFVTLHWFDSVVCILFCFCRQVCIVSCRTSSSDCTLIPSESSAYQTRRTRTLKWTWTRNGSYRRRLSTVGPSGRRLLGTVCADVFARWYYAARLPTLMDRSAPPLSLNNTGVTCLYHGFNILHLKCSSLGFLSL